MDTGRLKLFVIEIEVLEQNYPEITTTPQQIIFVTAPPSRQYEHIFDTRIFGSFTNSLRKIAFSNDDDIFVGKVNGELSRSLRKTMPKKITNAYKDILAYKRQKLINAQNISVSFGDGLLENITVGDALKTVFAAEHQHSSEVEKRKLVELRSAPLNTFDEMVRGSAVRLTELLVMYKNALVEELLND